MRKSVKLNREKREKLKELRDLDGLAEKTDEDRSKMAAAKKRLDEIDDELDTAERVEEEEDETRAREHGDVETTDPETRERLELRGRSKVGRFLSAALRGRSIDGAEAELAEAAGVGDAGIPLELWNPSPDEIRARRPRGRTEDRAITPAPDTVGMNVAPLQPYVFAPSLAPRLMVEMPTVESGSYLSGTISTAATGDAVEKGAEVPETPAAFTMSATTPHRVGAAVRVAVEDIAAIGTPTFDPILREHISVVLSDELDDQMLNGDGQNHDLEGLFHKLTDPAAPGAGVVKFDGFVAAFADGIDGLWSTMVSDVAIVCGTDTYRLSAKTFRDAVGQDLGETSFADYARQHSAGWWTNKRMPAAAANIQQAILCRKGDAMMPRPMRRAVCPTWGYISIDDIYSGAGKGERRFVVSALVGDLILVQPAAYAQVAFRISE